MQHSCHTPIRECGSSSAKNIPIRLMLNRVPTIMLSITLNAAMAAIAVTYGLSTASYAATATGAACYTDSRGVNSNPALTAFIRSANNEASYFQFRRESATGTDELLLNETFPCLSGGLQEETTPLPSSAKPLSSALHGLTQEESSYSETVTNEALRYYHKMWNFNLQDVKAINASYLGLPRVMSASDVNQAVSAFSKAVLSIRDNLAHEGNRSRWKSMTDVMLTELNDIHDQGAQDLKAILAQPAFAKLETNPAKFYWFLVARAAEYSPQEGQEIPSLTPYYAKILLLYSLQVRLSATGASGKRTLDALAQRLHLKADITPNSTPNSSRDDPQFSNTVFSNGYLLGALKSQSKNLNGSGQSDASEAVTDCTSFLQLLLDKIGYHVRGKLWSGSYTEVPMFRNHSSLGEDLSIKAGDIIFLHKGEDGHAMVVVGFTPETPTSLPQPIVIDAIGNSTRGLRIQPLQIFTLNKEGCVSYQPQGYAAGLLTPDQNPVIVHMN